MAINQEFPFNEFIYLLLNQDVAQAVKSGKCQSGLSHYQKNGIIEGRRTTRWSKQLHFINRVVPCDNLMNLLDFKIPKTCREAE